MQPGKTWWLLKIHSVLPDLEALVYNFQPRFTRHK